MLKYKVALIFQKSPKKNLKQFFYWNAKFFKIAQIMTKYLGYFCEKIGHNGIFLKIVQSGHTVLRRTWSNHVEKAWTLKKWLGLKNKK